LQKRSRLLSLASLRSGSAHRPPTTGLHLASRGRRQTNLKVKLSSPQVEASISRLFTWAAWSDKFGGSVQAKRGEIVRVAPPPAARIAPADTDEFGSSVQTARWNASFREIDSLLLERMQTITQLVVDSQPQETTLYGMTAQINVTNLKVYGD